MAVSTKITMGSGKGSVIGVTWRGLLITSSSWQEIEPTGSVGRSARFLSCCTLSGSSSFKFN